MIALGLDGDGLDAALLDSAVLGRPYGSAYLDLLLARASRYIASQTCAQTAWHSAILWMTCFTIEGCEAMRYPFDSPGFDLRKV
ncbi:hypothetical protein BER93_16510 [Xanthomonas fragariae]|nr:hypothetical protein BER92_16460 [Xanthomonas fragariae]AOD19415.1 hypothetical protein BER93_16510 [Xanthomonas fragariae]ENZ96989.1 hypothetical protein O1K_02144 [Xanthomonas fragariae LMG 25863]